MIMETTCLENITSIIPWDNFFGKWFLKIFSVFREGEKQGSSYSCRRSNTPMLCIGVGDSLGAWRFRLLLANDMLDFFPFLWQNWASCGTAAGEDGETSWQAFTLKTARTLRRLSSASRGWWKKRESSASTSGASTMRSPPRFSTARTRPFSAS